MLGSLSCLHLMIWGWQVLVWLCVAQFSAPCMNLRQPHGLGTKLRKKMLLVTFLENMQLAYSLSSFSHSCWAKFHNIPAWRISLNVVKPGTKRKFNEGDSCTILHQHHEMWIDTVMYCASFVSWQYHWSWHHWSDYRSLRKPVGVAHWTHFHPGYIRACLTT
jgi:hypothetical protein